MNSILLKFKNFGLFELLAILSAAYVVFMLAWTFKLINSKKINLKMNNQTLWQELSRKFVGQLSTGACLEFAVGYNNIIKSKGLPRDSH